MQHKYVKNMYRNNLASKQLQVILKYGYPYKPSFGTVIERGSIPVYTGIIFWIMHTSKWVALEKKHEKNMLF